MIDCSVSKGKLPHMWSKCIGAGRACEGLRAHWQEQLRIAKKECGFVSREKWSQPGTARTSN